MSITLTAENKNVFSITNENKSSGSQATWGNQTGRTWADGGTWGDPGVAIIKDSKNTLTITNENKN